ncbi:piggyBac transposable element-derived protein 4-like [Lineus longissimus]|uniref:piggyBac transposable element-derived protein 4-like n=1 Tax=Lineus longissimus TaxID=88925 RepID=UPI00315D6018
MYVVRNLTRNMRGFGHHLFNDIDNFYSSPALCFALMDHDIGVCGTVRPNRVGYPKNFHTIPLARGQKPLFKRAENVIACTWQDNKRVNMLSTIHCCGVTPIQVRDKKEATGFRNVSKPDCVIQHNKYMGRVDLMDQYLQYYEYPHRSNKWYMPLYHRIRETAMVNGYILYHKVHNDKMTHLKFREDLIEGLLQGITPSRKQRGRPSDANRDVRLVERHFGWIPFKNYKPNCTVCSLPSIKRVQTSNGCQECKKPMCWPDCFKAYHTEQHFRIEGRRILQRKLDVRH